MRLKSRGSLTTETLWVIVLFSVMAAIASQSLGNLSVKARISRLRAVLYELQIACDSYGASLGSLPSLSPHSAYSLVDFSAITPEYLRTEPASDGRLYSLGKSPVYFGITLKGKVFATIEPPGANGYWASLEGNVHSASGPLWLEPVLPEAPPETTVEIASIILNASSESEDVGGTITVTARAQSSAGVAVPHARLTFTLTGSKSGERQIQALTDSQGLACAQVTSDTAEIVLVRVSSRGGY